MSGVIKKEESLFYLNYPATKQTYWFVINGAKEAIKTAEETPALVIRYIDWIKSELKSLDDELSKGLYRGYEDCIELKEIRKGLEDSREKLIKVASDYDIDWKNDWSNINQNDE